ncbi:unnamed protein product [Allacma fusca]|uniref:Uncharacterized protein n=1 Tax=Allacma fusca TaxID=39272 RepID=A0A8J2KLI9_9HEXA|nr:unnamed protein product [Allacma fusca]
MEGKQRKWHMTRVVEAQQHSRMLLGCEKKESKLGPGISFLSVLRPLPNHVVTVCSPSPASLVEPFQPPYKCQLSSHTGSSEYKVEDYLLPFDTWMLNYQPKPRHHLPLMELHHE